MLIGKPGGEGRRYIGTLFPGQFFCKPRNMPLKGKVLIKKW